MLALAAVVLMAATPAAAREDTGETDRLPPKAIKGAIGGLLRTPLVPVAPHARADYSSACASPLPTAEKIDRALLDCANSKKDGLETGVDCKRALPAASGRDVRLCCAVGPPSMSSCKGGAHDSTPGGNALVV